MVVDVKLGRGNRLIPVAPLDAGLHREGGGGWTPVYPAGRAQGTGTLVPRPGRCEALPGAGVGHTGCMHMP